MSQDNDLAPGASPQQPPTPWISTQHEMETSARPGRTRFLRIKLAVGRVSDRVRHLSVFRSPESPATRAASILYRVTLQWLAELDSRDGKTEKIVERDWANRALNTLQFRVLEATAPDGKRSAFARLGPRGQIAAEPKNVGLMGFLRAILVEWVAEQHPDAVIIRGSMSQPDVPSDEDKTLRNAFFARAGFTVLPTSDGAGTYHAPSIRSLRTAWNTDKVVELTAPMVAEAFGGRLEAHHPAQEGHRAGGRAELRREPEAGSRLPREDLAGPVRGQRRPGDCVQHPAARCLRRRTAATIVAGAPRATGRRVD